MLSNKSIIFNFDTTYEHWSPLIDNFGTKTHLEREEETERERD